MILKCFWEDTKCCVVSSKCMILMETREMPLPEQGDSTCCNNLPKLCQSHSMCNPLSFKPNQSEGSGSWPWVPRIMSLSRSILFVALLWYLTLRCFFPCSQHLQPSCVAPILAWPQGLLASFQGNGEMRRYLRFFLLLLFFSTAPASLWQQSEAVSP